jgi:hypothetical protein
MAYLPATQTGTQDQAKSYLNTLSQQKRGTNFTDQEFGQLAGKIGYQGGDVSGAQVNQAIDALGWGGAGGATGVPLPASGGAAPPAGAQQQAQSVQLAQQGGGQGVGTATTQTANAGTTTNQQQGGVDPNVAFQQVQSSFQAKHGRAMTDAEVQQATQYAQSLGYTGGQIPQQILDQVLAQVQSYNPNAAPPQTGGTPPPSAAGGGIDPTVAQKQVDDAFLQKFGRKPSAQEMQWLQTMAGYGGSGAITEDMMKKALDSIGRYTGKLDNPFEVNTGGSNAAEQAALKHLEETIKKPIGVPDLNSAEYKGQIDQNRLRAQREYEGRRAAMAERAAAEGRADTGGFDIDVERAAQSRGQQESAFEADLIAGSLKDQRADLQQALQLAIQTGQQDKARQLQEKLATLDLDLKKYQTKGQLGLGLLGIGTQNEQFLKSLGLDYAQLQNLMNNQAMQAILAGGY